MLPRKTERPKRRLRPQCDMSIDALRLRGAVLRLVADRDRPRFLHPLTRSIEELIERMSIGIANPADRVTRNQAGRIPVAVVVPTTANPFHIGHLDLTLRAMCETGADYGVVLPQGEFHKLVNPPHNVPCEHRHAMVQSVVRELHPLLRYSAVGIGNASIGEVNVHRLMGQTQNPTDFRICFGDDGDPKRVNRILRNLTRAAQEIGFQPRRPHQLGVVFVQRGPTALSAPPNGLLARLNESGVTFLGSILQPYQCWRAVSSSKCRAGDSAALPPVVARYIKAHKLYT